MPDPEDIIDVRDVSAACPDDEATSHVALGPRRKWLSIWFQCCHVYGRLNRNAEATRYEGRCPRCGARAHALIGEGGTNQRLFRAE